MNLKIVSLVFIVLGVTSCIPEQTTVSPPVDTTQSFSRAGTEQMPHKWWRAFEDQGLDKLVDTALANNFNLRTTWQRLQEARAVVDRASSDFFPSLDASIQGESSSFLSDFRQSQSFRLGMSAGYEVDLWGRIGSRVEAERYRAQASRSDYKTAALSLSAGVVRTWFQLAEARSQLELISNQIETNRKVLELMEARFGSGQIRSPDILRQRRLLESTREQKLTVESQQQVLEHRLAVLLGRPPQGDLDTGLDSLPSLPPLPETGMPMELVRRRPDVRQAYRQLQAADRDWASAASRRYPRLSLSASLTTGADQAGNLFKDWARSLAGNLMTPLFYGGQLNAEVDRTRAVKKQRLYHYGQTVLNAFREVEDALIQECKKKQTIESLQRQLQLANQTYQQLRLEYFNGMGDYLDVLTALDQAQRLRRELLSAKLQLLEYRVALYRALAGGFQTAREANQPAPDGSGQNNGDGHQTKAPNVDSPKNAGSTSQEGNQDPPE